MLIEKGSIRHDPEPCASFIIPLRTPGYSEELTVQFDKGQGTNGEVKRWFSLLPLVAIEGDTCIRVIDDKFAFIWVQWFHLNEWNVTRGGLGHDSTAGPSGTQG